VGILKPKQQNKNAQLNLRFALFGSLRRLAYQNLSFIINLRPHAIYIEKDLPNQTLSSPGRPKQICSYIGASSCPSVDMRQEEGGLSTTSEGR